MALSSVRDKAHSRIFVIGGSFFARQKTKGGKNIFLGEASLYLFVVPQWAPSVGGPSLTGEGNTQEG